MHWSTVRCVILQMLGLPLYNISFSSITFKKRSSPDNAFMPENDTHHISMWSLLFLVPNHPHYTTYKFWVFPFGSPLSGSTLWVSHWPFPVRPQGVACPGGVPVSVKFGRENLSSWCQGLIEVFRVVDRIHIVCSRVRFWSSGLSPWCSFYCVSAVWALVLLFWGSVLALEVLASHPCFEVSVFALSLSHAACLCLGAPPAPIYPWKSMNTQVHLVSLLHRVGTSAYSRLACWKIHDIDMTSKLQGPTELLLYCALGVVYHALNSVSHNLLKYTLEHHSRQVYIKIWLMRCCYMIKHWRIKTTVNNYQKNRLDIWSSNVRYRWQSKRPLAMQGRRKLLSGMADDAQYGPTVKETTVAMVEYTCWDWSSRNDIYRMKWDCPSCYENENLKMNMNYVYWVPLTLTEWGPKLKRLDTRSHRRVWPEKINMMTNALYATLFLQLKSPSTGGDVIKKVMAAVMHKFG